jgi:ABC-type phosphate/phosphonate transport system ATPase subunit
MRASHDPVSADTLVADPQAPPVVIETRGLQKTYFGKVAVPVLHGIDLRIRAGEFVAIIGQSGSGKSTLLNILGALDVPTGGTVLINGVDIGTLDDDALADLRSTGIGFIFQFHHLLDEYTCVENGNGWRWHERWCSTLVSFLPMSRPATSIATRARRSSR